ncbi:MAG: hypothetical protein R3F22_05020 [Lysobacteraceae bacterium]
MTQDRKIEPGTEALSSEEQRVAALYRSLPTGEPSPALDARIRAQAHAAVKPARRQRPTWLWGAGVAASAVLAVGMFWRMGLPEMQQRGPAVSEQALPGRTVVLDSAEPAPPPMPPEPHREPGSSALSSAAGSAEETADAGQPASPVAQMSANQATGGSRDNNAQAPTQESFADDRAEATKEAKNEADALQSLRARKQSTDTALATTDERETEAAAGRRNGEAQSNRRPHRDPPPLIFPEPEFGPPLKLPEENVAKAPKSGRAETGLRPPVRVAEPAPMAVEAPPPAPPAAPPPPVVFDAPAEKAIEMPPPAPPAAPAPAAEIPQQVAPAAGAPSVVRSQEENAEPEAEHRQLGKLKDDVLGTIDVSGDNVSPIDVSSVESADVLAETSTRETDAVTKAIAELPRRFRRDVGNNAKLYPESWLARIDALLATDRRDEAVANLRVFRVAYPTHGLPEALASLAREEGIESPESRP